MKSNYQKPTTKTVWLHGGAGILSASPGSNGMTATQAGYTNYNSDEDNSDGFSQE